MIIEDYEQVDRILRGYHIKSEEELGISQIKVIYMMIQEGIHNLLCSCDQSEEYVSKY